MDTSGSKFTPLTPYEIYPDWGWLTVLWFELDSCIPVTSPAVCLSVSLSLVFLFAHDFCPRVIFLLLCLPVFRASIRFFSLFPWLVPFSDAHSNFAFASLRFHPARPGFVPGTWLFAPLPHSLGEPQLKLQPAVSFACLWLLPPASCSHRFPVPVLFTLSCTKLPLVPMFSLAYLNRSRQKVHTLILSNRPFWHLVWPLWDSSRSRSMPVLPFCRSARLLYLHQNRSPCLFLPARFPAGAPSPCSGQPAVPNWWELRW